ncbi:ser thr-rich protein t10 in dgcr region [Moniliophthora roreri MCA 2997]|uniref:Ser thr-rich protein t10 in dgcr region n=2 Tax=Moniliophthora roreri TaxID=221103 RepID=V2WYZ5_MONRO|nr:ser thr-rich protein t10 in dgcr region [Moniliophthora roreri MCA 2997]KAI3621168.1 ser thr-rich protein t10 in dgcr region [Moniliophthora roreri]
MCIAFWTLDHPDYSLILCSNRDEFLDRPTRDARFHSFGHEDSEGTILSGIDEMGGGTWLGLTRAGKIALLTNITEPPSAFGSTRGSLVLSFLQFDSEDPLDKQVKNIFPRDAEFAGFNLLLFAPQGQPLADDRDVDTSGLSELKFEACFVTNSGAGGPITNRYLTSQERACGGFSNGIDGKRGNEWPKVQHGLQDFGALISQSLPSNGDENKPSDEFTLVQHLFKLLSWRSPEPVTERGDLRKTVQVCPIPANWGEKPSHYGTRLSTVLLIRRDGQATFIERDIWKLVDGKVTKMDVDSPSERTFRFTLERRVTQTK